MAPIVTETCWPALPGLPRFGGVTDLSRYDDWLVWLRKRGESDRAVRVVFVGGSAVTGGYDEHSDLDVEVLAEPGEAVAAYQRLLEAARRDFKVYAVWELPEGTWPDGRQAFLNLTPDAADLSVPTRIIDLHVSDLADHHRLVDPRRHGEPLVLHDPDGLVELRPDDEDAMERERREAVAQIAARRPTAAWLVNRAIARGQLGEAVAFHLQFAVNPLVRLLRIVHSPARHDFGLRYLDTDLPDGYAQRVEALLPGPGLQARADAAFAWQDRLLATLAEHPRD
jgi:predicted nucleotidyltransferase